MTVEQTGQYYFEVEGQNFVQKGNFMGMEKSILVPGIVAGRSESSWLRHALIMGVLAVTPIPGIFLFDEQYKALSILVGLGSAIATGIIYDNFSKIRNLAQRRAERSLSS